MNQRDVTFTIMITEENPDRMLLMRNVNDYTTHWMDPEGVWQPFPEDDEHLQQLFEDLAAPDALPKLEPAS